MALWRLPPVGSHDQIVVDWHGLPFTRESGFPVCMMLVQGINDFNWRTVFDGGSCYSLTGYELSGSGTFVFEAGELARIEPTAILPRGLGELVDYGNTVSVGSISCEVPPSDVARGIACSDATSGHGFEASRVPSRQSAY